jgi:type I restriction enzyme S subunit
MGIKKVRDLIIEDKSGVYGLGLSAEPYNGKVRYLRITDIDDSGNLLDYDKKSVTTEQEDDYLLKQDDLVVARTGNSTGRTYVYDKSDGPMVYAGFLIKYVFDKNKINPRYLKYFTTTSIYRNQTAKYSGSTRGNMSAQDFKNIKIVFPDRVTQDKLVVLFDSINKKLINNNKINAELESMAKTLYDYWFLQFEFPNENGKPYKSSGGKMVYNERLKREIPEGWKVKHAYEIAEIKTGKEDANHSTPNGKYPFFTCSNDILRCDDYKFEGNVILIAGNGDFNVKHYIGKFNAYQRTYVIKPYDEKYVGLFHIYCKESIEKFEKGSNGSIVKFITLKDIQNIIMLDSNNNDLLTPFNIALELIDSLKKQNEELVSLRDFLLPLLMNGQVTFKGTSEEEIENTIAKTTIINYMLKFNQGKNSLGYVARGNVNDKILMKI